MAGCGGATPVAIAIAGRAIAGRAVGNAASVDDTIADRPTPAPVGLLLEVTSEGGFINPSASIGALPRVVVETDGRIFTPASAPDGSQPLVPPVEVRDTGPGGAAAILAAIRAAGLDTERSGGMAADTGSTVFTAVIDGETIVSRFAAGGPGGPGGPGVGARCARRAGAPAPPGADAFALLARLTGPRRNLGRRDPAAGPALRPGRLPRLPGADRRGNDRRRAVAPRDDAGGVRHAGPRRISASRGSGPGW